MKTPTMTTMTTFTSTALLLLPALVLTLAVLGASPALAQGEIDDTSAEMAADPTADTPAEAGPDCSRFGFKKISLGMTMAEVKEQYADVAADKGGPVAQAPGGRGYHWQQKDGAQQIGFHVLANGEGDAAAVVQIEAEIHGGGISPTQWHSALLQKWGGITELREDDPAPGQTTIEGRSVDDSCDAHVEFLGTGNDQQMSLQIKLVSIAATREWEMHQAEEATRNRASDVLE